MKQIIERLRQQQALLANFGSFAFREANLQLILDEAARVCAISLGADRAKICRHRPIENDLLVVAGFGWDTGIVGMSSPRPTKARRRAAPMSLASR